MDDVHVGSLDGERRLLDVELLRSRTGEVTVLHGAGRYHRSLGIRSAGHVLVVDIREDIVSTLYQRHAVVGQCGSGLLRLAVVGQVGHLAHEAVLQRLLADGERLGVLTHIEIMSLHGLDGHRRSILFGILVAGHHIVRVGHGIVRAQHQHLAAVLHGEGRCMCLCVVDHGQDVGDGDVGMAQHLVVGGRHLYVGTYHGERPCVLLTLHGGELQLLLHVDACRCGATRCLGHGCIPAGLLALQLPALTGRDDYGHCLSLAGSRHGITVHLEGHGAVLTGAHGEVVGRI